ncbi:MAG TPA: hypothetical protein VFQ57_01600 [Sphingomonas sp.]|jgi:hypothetical protein|nr:hypothetical protein [Sphingomonas sp.]
MIRAGFALAAVAAAVPHGAAAPDAPVAAPIALANMRPAPAPPPSVRLPGFAASLAQQPMPGGMDAWTITPDEDAWAAIASSDPLTRQAVRWRFAISLIGTDRGPDALGVLDVMAQDDPDLKLVPAWRRAYGVAAIMAGHDDDGLMALSDGMLTGDPESCLWRMRALADTAHSVDALHQLRCALPALTGRPQAARRPFVLAAADAAVEIEAFQPALDWLKALPDRDPAANLLRGQAMAALGQAQPARLRLQRVLISGNAEERAAATIGAIEADLASHVTTPAAAAKKLDALLYSWRGDAIEQRGLRLSLQLADTLHAPERLMAAGAALFRYGKPDASTAPLLARMQAQLAAALAPGSGLPLDRAAGLFWDYRDIAPAGQAGDQLAEALCARLQSVGLYARAADLLEHQLAGRPQDIERGPLSVRIATLRILDGSPADAVRVIQSTNAIAYPTAITADRRRVEAIALELLGKSDDALAVLDDVPDAAAIAAEIHWRERDWGKLAAVNASVLPAARRLTTVEQAIVLRQAVALAMLGREPALTGLRNRYAASFAGLPTAAAFTMLTSTSGPIDPAALGKAMAALPSDSPAGKVGELLDEGDAALDEKRASKS